MLGGIYCMDITLKVEDYKLNMRAAGIIIHNNKVLLHKNVNADHYAVIGGRIKIGESSYDAVKREILEETGKEVEITGYIATIENFFELKGEKYHEILFVHKAEFKDEKDKQIELTDEQVIEIIAKVFFLKFIFLKLLFLKCIVFNLSINNYVIN